VTTTGTAPAWERYAWTAGVVFVVALLAETAISAGIPIDQNDSAAKIARELDHHSTLVLIAACVSVAYAAAFPIYLWKLYGALTANADSSRALASLVLVGGTVFVALHAVSDVAIYGLLGSKLASYGAHHDPGISFTLYLMTFALDSVGDVFASLFALATGVLVFRSGVLPRWLAWVSMLVAVLLFLQAFGLGGVIATFGLALDLIGFVLLLLFVVASSVILLRRANRFDQAGSQAPGQSLAG
jgi:hypothetical protein